MTSNYHAAKSFTLAQLLACGIVALKTFDHNQFMSKYDHIYDNFLFDLYHYQDENLKLTHAKHMNKQCKSIYPLTDLNFIHFSSCGLVANVFVK